MYQWCGPGERFLVPHSGPPRGSGGMPAAAACRQRRCNRCRCWLHQHQACSTCFVGVLCRKGFAGEPYASAIALALQHLRFHGRRTMQFSRGQFVHVIGCTLKYGRRSGNNFIHRVDRGSLNWSSPSEIGRARIARARRRGHLAKFGGRGGVRRHAETQRSRGARVGGAGGRAGAVDIGMRWGARPLWPGRAHLPLV